MHTAPDWLPEEAQPYWQEISAELPAAPSCRQRTAAAMAAQLMLQFERVTASINQNGQVSEIRDDKGVLRKQEPAPEVRIQMQLVDRVPKLLSNLDAGTDATTPRAPTVRSIFGDLERIAGSGDAAPAKAARKRRTQGRRGVRP